MKTFETFFEFLLKANYVYSIWMNLYVILASSCDGCHHPKAWFWSGSEI